MPSVCETSDLEIPDSSVRNEAWGYYRRETQKNVGISLQQDVGSSLTRIEGQ